MGLFTCSNFRSLSICLHENFRIRRLGHFVVTVPVDTGEDFLGDVEILASSDRHNFPALSYEELGFRLREFENQIDCRQRKADTLNLK